MSAPASNNTLNSGTTNESEPDDLRCRSSPAARAGICRRHPHQCWPRQRLTIQKAAFLAPDWGSRSRAAHCREHKYGKPILDRVVHPEMRLGEVAKLILLSFDAALRSNLSVGMPIDL